MVSRSFGGSRGPKRRDPFRLRQRDHLVDCSPSHPQRYPVVGSQEQRRESEQRLLAGWSAGGAVAIGFGHEDALENVVAAAGGPQARRVPVAEHLHLRRLDDHRPHHGPAPLIVAGRTVLAHQATGQDHRGVRDAAGETEPPGDHIAAVDPLGVAGRDAAVRPNRRRQDRTSAGRCPVPGTRTRSWQRRRSWRTSPAPHRSSRTPRSTRSAPTGRVAGHQARTAPQPG